MEEGREPYVPPHKVEESISAQLAERGVSDLNRQCPRPRTIVEQQACLVRRKATKDKGDKSPQEDSDSVEEKDNDDVPDNWEDAYPDKPARG